MSGGYLPASNFLISIANEEIPIDHTEFGQANLRRLIEMTRDADRSNRDWAALLLSQQEIDSPQIRDALIAAADDEDQYVRAEAIEGLVSRDRAKALEFVQRELSGAFACASIFRAAAELADPSLVPLIEPFAEPSEDEYLDQIVNDALAACRGPN